ncbi:MAG: hypothetical protein A2496_10955 [Burkholderiales bacterium RIFOXYC12_FULL_60_6]|nr:MAG: hypothetical protein A2496_10955 [Burkholderiales bacterium RIFOXYC12_FULL_60_6]
MGARLATFRTATVLLPFLLAGCSPLLPRSEAAIESPWQNYQEAIQTFDKIIPQQTTVFDLKQLRLDPETNPNITILNYSDILRRFIPSGSINALDLDNGVRECILAKTACKGYEIDQRAIKRKRIGNFWADFLNFKREVNVVGWRFNGIILIKDNVVIYKLTGGQPNIHEMEESRNPLGPFQGFGESRLFGR